MVCKTPRDMVLLVLFTSLLFCGSCAMSPARMYGGPELPAGRTALIVPATEGITLESCDGVKVTSRAVTVQPGEHSVEISFNEVVGVKREYSTTPCLMKFTAEAGHTYRVDRTQPVAGVYSGFIGDRNTGKQVVSGCMNTPRCDEEILFK